jgi:hypothetical protein
LLRKFIQAIHVDRQSDSINVYLKKIPGGENGYNGNLTSRDLAELNTNGNDGVVVVTKKVKRQIHKKKTNGDAQNVPPVEKGSTLSAETMGITLDVLPENQ